eukprot:scaffold13018_cov50-Cyclotella_meneghiniana.AAC.1
MNGFESLRFEFIIHNHHHTPAFDLWVVTISAPVPYVPHQDGVFLDLPLSSTASQPFQLLIISVMNGWRRWRLAYGL